VLLRIQGLGFKDPTLWPFFARERKSGSSIRSKDSNLCCQVKSTQNGLEFRKFGRLLAPFFVVAVFSAFLRVYPFGVNCSYYNEAVASAANLESRNVLLFPTSTKTAAVGVNKQYHLQSSGI
jgi:hypothetical protein